jgi:hypothetical protein
MNVFAVSIPARDIHCTHQRTLATFPLHHGTAHSAPSHHTWQVCTMSPFKAEVTYTVAHVTAQFFAIGYDQQSHVYAETALSVDGDAP